MSIIDGKGQDLFHRLALINRNQEPREKQAKSTDKTGGHMVADRFMQSAELEEDGAAPPRDGKPPYSMNTEDNIENRTLKSEYSTVDSLLDGPPPQFDGVEPSFRDGMYTLRKDGENGKWVEYSYSEDRSHVIVKDSGGTSQEFYRGEGNTIRAVDRNSSVQSIYDVDNNGTLSSVTTKPDGTTKSRIANADGSYTTINEAGESKTRAKDPGMAQYDAIAKRMARVIGKDGGEAELSDEQRYILTTGLSQYDMATLENFEKTGVKIRLYDHRNPPPGGFPGPSPNDWNEGRQGNILGKYVHDNRGNKEVQLRLADFQNGGNLDGLGTIRHELGHAADDMLQPDGANVEMNKLSDNDRDGLQKLYNDYLKRIDPAQGGDPKLKWSDYATTNYREYLAEGIRMYLGGERSRAALEQMDKPLFDHVKTALENSKDQSLPDRKFEQQPPQNPIEGFFKGLMEIIMLPIKLIKGLFDGIAGAIQNLFK